MNKHRILKYTALFLVVVIAFFIYTNIMDWRYKRHAGAVTLKIVDDDGNIVSDADVFTHFVNFSKIQRDFRTKSDENGLYHAKGYTISHLFYIISKNGYYNTEWQYSFIRKDQGKARKRNKWLPWIVRWEPWNPTETVVLKRIKNPIAMKVREVEFLLPSKEQYYPFDLDVGDLVEPYGTGKKANIYIYYYANMKNMFAGKTIFKFAVKDKNTGYRRTQFEEYSKYQTIYLTSINNYTNLLEFVSESTEDKQIIDTKLKKNEYIVFKCQNNTNSTMYNYGKIYPRLSCWTQEDQSVKVKFTYYYNPIPNDRNLEFDPKQNLIDYSHMRKWDRPMFKP